MPNPEEREERRRRIEHDESYSPELDEQEEEDCYDEM